MQWQLLAVGLIVAGAVGYLARRAWRTWAGRKSGCGGCGCKPADRPAARAAVIPLEQVVPRRRDVSRP